jgi:hypothetical protein
MRARKIKLPLSLDSLLATLVPGRTYTVQVLSLLYEGGAQAIESVLDQARQMGAIEVSGKNRGYRKRYWLRDDFRPNVTTRRTQPAEVSGMLQGYDLMALARLAQLVRRQ